MIRARDRDALRQHLTAADVGTEIYYPVPLHLQQCFAYLGYQQRDFPQSERAARKRSRCPSTPSWTKRQLQYVVDSVAHFYLH